MTYQVGQQILGGSVVVATVDPDDLILSVQIPTLHDINGNPFTITYSGGVTEMFVANILTSVTQAA